jgi:23S rRNA (cytosine1962-C5)-methyltransferase
MLPALKLKRNEDRRLRAGHLWVFSNEVDNVATPLTRFTPGELARVLSDRDQFLGYAYVNPAALIAARIVSRLEREQVNAVFFKERIAAALQLRASLYSRPYYRWVYGESDRLPGLVLDRFGEIVVGQIGALGMERCKPWVEAAVQATPGVATLIWKNDGGARALENLPEEVVLAFGNEPAALKVIESPVPGKALEYTVPLRDGQKTGWFYDQTHNRQRLAEYVRPGMRMLDVCSYAGGWAVGALAAGAASASCIDSSASALKHAEANAAANGYAIEPLRGDAFEVLQALAVAGRKFDLVVVDPPAFIKRKKDQPQGIAA